LEGIAMREPFAVKLAESRACRRCASYWQSVLRFGLPFVVLFQGIDYLISRVTGKPWMWGPWWLMIAMSAVAMFVASAVWWAFMREIAIWKRKNQ
jgi:hypothetical protein